ncbi:hypothetical protein HW555_000574 [Spodoptera exigua]|uniref:Uncharacterized protein n=1 Tax=Spodoptera exigua TaxID=7107 RepID=A0A835GQV6_SPOEX|nr:hypothetical protein HW555_000574 [Spodoptera exigua]
MTPNSSPTKSPGAPVWFTVGATNPTTRSFFADGMLITTSVVYGVGGLHLLIPHAREGPPPQLLQQDDDGRDQLGARRLQPVQGFRTPVHVM